MNPFEVSLRTRIVFGENSVDRLGELCGDIRVTSVFLVTDPGVVAAGHVERAERALEAGGIACVRFDGVRENPTTADVDAALAALGDHEVGGLVGFGGGSAIDVAKGVNFLHAGGGRLEDYWGKGKAKGDLLPLIAVPTTAGTGTETQSFALIEQEGTHQKMACGDLLATPAIAVLDPTLTVTLPPRQTALTGLDTVGHAVESAVSTKRTALSALFSTESLEFAHRGLARVLDVPDDLEARGAMLLAAAYGGLAIERSMLGAAHSMANPLTALFGVTHGLAVALALPAVVRFNAEEPVPRAIYADLARAAGLCPAKESEASAVDSLVEWIGGLMDHAGLDRRLAAHGVDVSRIGELAAGATRQWTAQFNPRPVSEDDFRTLYEAVS